MNDTVCSAAYRLGRVDNALPNLHDAIAHPCHRENDHTGQSSSNTCQDQNERHDHRSAK